MCAFVIFFFFLIFAINILRASSECYVDFEIMCIFDNVFQNFRYFYIILKTPYGCLRQRVTLVMCFTFATYIPRRYMDVLCTLKQYATW